MKIALLRIGNSRGIRIPRRLIEQCRLANTVELYLEGKRLIIEAQRRPREGWREAFSAAGPSVDGAVAYDRSAAQQV